MTNIERLIERLYESKPDKEEYDMKKIIVIVRQGLLQAIVHIIMFGKMIRK